MVLDLEAARVTLADEWRTKNPITSAEVAAFYRETPNYVPDLDAWHATPERQLWTAAVVAAARVAGAARILDVGAGAGHDLRALREALPDAHLEAVEPNRVMRGALLDAGVYCADRIDLTPGTFDLIVCIDVLEHVPDPVALVVAMVERTRVGSVIVEATATHDIETPLHLPELRGYSPGRHLDAFGFEVREQFGRLRVWQRTRERGTDAPHLLLCAYRTLTVETAECADALARRGWRRSTHRGDALVSRVRSIAMSEWLRETNGDVFLMVDDDIIFRPEDAERVVALARKHRAIACAAYPVRGGSHLAIRGLTRELSFGPGLGPVEIRWAATGFMAVHRDACEALISRHELPLCHEDQSWAFWPAFDTFWMRDPDPPHATQYLSEDWAFCQRAREAGVAVWLDPTVVLGHIGQAVYSVETMAGATPQPPPTDGGAR